MEKKQLGRLKKDHLEPQAIAFFVTHLRAPGSPKTRISNVAGQPQGFRKVTALIVWQPLGCPQMFKV